ncbi:MAG: FkbM family methyltransferase [Selenomonadaceae bacterium]|nr:FkbM family methyltransferase [Selenomonadaceae bacterium]
MDDVVSIPYDSKVFLKIDIEGAEPAALRGAKKILTTNKVKASVCSYHNADDIIKIKSIFQNCGYKIATSEGYMIFVYDPKIWETADFRKGVIYAENF